MKDLRTRFVAVEYNENGTCKKVLSCVNLTESEYKKLLNESLVSKQHGLARLEKQKQDYELLKKKLEEEQILQAKSIFDNFVDRGLIEDDEELQKDFYDFFFNDTPLTYAYLKNEHFMKILNKIRGN